MSADISILSEMTDINDNVKKMVLALPLFEIGDKLHDIFVNKLQGSTPGRHSKLFGEGDIFIDIFFPNWRAIDFTSDVSGITGLSDSWWSDFAVSVLCQSMDRLTHDLHPQLLHDQINNAVNSYNATLNLKAVPFYSYVFSKTFSDFSIPFNVIDRNTAKTQYKQVLKDGVNIHTLWYAQGLWKNPDWEMFHHFIKLMALGASNEEINQLIDELRNAGLPILNDIDKGNWQSFNGFLYNHPIVDHNDIDSTASNGILKSEYLPSMSPYGGSWMKEENSFEFTAIGQPGNKYRETPGGGSCFSKGTSILMHDFSVKPIEEVQSGDRVASPTGSREVAFVSTPFRRGRTLYSFNGLSFCFTATHPFINSERSEKHPQLLSVNPKELKLWIPTLSKGGIAKIENGVKVIQVQASKFLQTEAITIETLNQHKVDNSKDELLYDLILQPDSSGTFEYIAGSDGNLFLVASEIPLISQHPYLTYTVLEMLSLALPNFMKKFESIDTDEFYKEVEQLRRFVVTELLHRSLSQRETTDFETSLEPLKSSEDDVTNMMQLFLTPEQEYDWIAGDIYEMLVAALGEEIETAIELGWRSLGKIEGDNIAVSIADLHLDSSHPIDLKSRLRLVIKFVVGDEQQELMTVSDQYGRENTRFVRYFDRVLYLDTKWIETEMPKKLLFEFFVDEELKPRLMAIAYLPHRFQPHYRRFAPRVQTEDKQMYGHLFFDIRLLSGEELEREQKSVASWRESSKLCFSKLLGKQMGNILVEKILN